jgi:hypothetical protein
MKYLLTILLLGIAIKGQCQSILDPSVPFALEAPLQIVLQPGDSTVSVLKVVRNRGYRKSPAHLVVSSELPAGVSFELSPNKEIIETASIKWKATPEVQPGEYVVVLSCKLQNLTKGVTVALVIDSPKVASADQR